MVDVVDFECLVGVVGTGFWRALEILLRLKDKVPMSKIVFTDMCDVYSYCMTCYELVTGRIPSEDYIRAWFKEGCDLVSNGQRSELPIDLDPLIREIIVSCWHVSIPSEKPSFRDIHNRLSVKVFQHYGLNRTVVGRWSGEKWFSNKIPKHYPFCFSKVLCLVNYEFPCHQPQATLLLDPNIVSFYLFSTTVWSGINMHVCWIVFEGFPGWAYHKLSSFQLCWHSRCGTSCFCRGWRVIVLLLPSINSLTISRRLILIEFRKVWMPFLNRQSWKIQQAVLSSLTLGTFGKFGSSPHLNASDPWFVCTVHQVMDLLILCCVVLFSCFLIHTSSCRVSSPLQTAI